MDRDHVWGERSVHDFMVKGWQVKPHHREQVTVALDPVSSRRSLHAAQPGINTSGDKPIPRARKCWNSPIPVRRSRKPQVPMSHRY